MLSIKKIIIGLSVVSLLVFSGCSSGGGSSSSDIVSSLSGVAQKGAFVKDSNVSLCKLDEKMDCTTDVLEAKVSDDKGSYEFKTLPWSGLSRLSIKGYYFDELTGQTSISPATITAIVDIKSNVKQKTNTNLLTDMRAKRMRELVDKGKSIDEASEESREDVKKLFNVTSDDFTALDLVDFSQGSASVNVELLRISAAVANAEDPVAVLEELMKIYNEYGIEAVLNSTLYKTLMGLIEDVDVKEVLTNMTSQEVGDAATIADLAPFAIANIITYGPVSSDNKVRISLIGTEFIATPSIAIYSSDNMLDISDINLSDDNKSVILEMNRFTSCADVNLTFSIASVTLKDVSNSLSTNQIRYTDENSLCITESIDDDVNTTPVTIDPMAIISLVALEHNQIRLSLLGTEFENYIGSINAELVTSSDTLAIDSMVVADNNKSVVFTLNEVTNYCAENNVTIHLNADSLKGIESVLESNKIRYVSPNTIADCGGGNSIPIPFNRAPTVAITPSTITTINVGTILELNATAVDANSEDTVTLQWLYKRVESDIFTNDGITSSQFIHQYDTLGRHIVNVTATDNYGAHTTASIEFEVVAVNHPPIVSISPSGDKNINVGTAVILESSASDEDGDELTISWKLKELGDADFTTVPSSGVTGFNYIFDTLGTYLVVVEAEDGNGSKADANITVVVSEVSAVVVTLNDIETSVVVKGSDSFPDQGQSGVAATIHTLPQHGTVELYLVGNENPYIRYTSTDCFVGTDSFIYKSGDAYGRVNVTITSPSNLNVLNQTKTLFNTQSIDGEYLRAKSASENVVITTQVTHGNSSLSVVGNEVINYSYDPQDSYIGNDFFEYEVTEVINECTYTDVGRVTFTINSLAPIEKSLTKADFRTLLSSDNPKDSDMFGSSVAIEEDTIVIGVPGKQIDGITGRGEVVVYQKTENGAEVIQRLENPDAIDTNRRFGFTLSLKDGMLAVVAPGMGTIGNITTIYSEYTRVYIYKQEDNATFSYVQTLNAITNNTGSYFAYKDIAINEKYVVIGAKKENVDGVDDAGAAYVYTKDGDFYTTIPLRIQDVDLSSGAWFAHQVALMDDLILIANPFKKVYESEGDTQKYGVLQVYKDNGTGIEHISTIKPEKGSASSYYGSRFSLSLGTEGNMLAVGAPYTTIDGKSETGYVNTYMRDGDELVLLAHIVDPDPIASERFGSTVAIENPYLVVGVEKSTQSNFASLEIFQYSGDNNYTQLGVYEPEATYRTWASFQERTNFATSLDISNGTVISGSMYAYNFSKLQSRSYRAGQAYLLECDMKRPYWIDYKKEVILSENNSYFHGRVSVVDDNNYSSYTTSGVGADSSQFTYDMNYINYSEGITSGYDNCVEQYPEEGTACDDSCQAFCEENGGEFGGGSASFDFYSPSDVSSDNRYEVDFKFSFLDQEFIYPFIWEVKDSIDIIEGHNNGMASSLIDYNRLQLTGVGTSGYAKKLIFEDAKAYVYAADSIYIYNKNETLSELLEYEGVIVKDDVVSSSNIDITNSYFAHTNSNAFDIDGSRVAVTGRHNGENYLNDSYIHLFNNGNYIESIVVYEDSQNIYPCEDDKECIVNKRILDGVQIANGHIFAQYQKQIYFHDDNETGYDEWENEYQYYESGVMIYSYDGTQYNLIQSIEVPGDNANISTIHSFSADGEFLLIHGSHGTDDYYNPYKFVKVYKFNGTSYSFIQNFTLPSDIGTAGKVSLENGYVLIETQKQYHTNLETQIYKYDSNNNNFALIDTITNEEAGATYTDAFTGVHIQVHSNGSVYLYKRFYKRLETQDFYSYDGGLFIANAAYIAVFKQDATTHKFRFVDSFTHKNGANYFADSFAVDGDVIIANTSNSGYLHSFRLEH